MARFVISERARKDMVDIWRYTLENWSEEQAVRYYNKLMDGCEQIASALTRFSRLQNITNSKTTNCNFYYEELEENNRLYLCLRIDSLCSPLLDSGFRMG